MNTEALRKKLAENIRMYRAKNKLSQEKLSEKANISIQYLWSLENEKYSPTIDVVYRIAEALGVTINDLVY